MLRNSAVRDHVPARSLRPMRPPPFVKVQNGVTYTIAKRQPLTDPPVYYWKSSKGADLDVTWQEVQLYGLYPDQL